MNANAIRNVLGMFFLGTTGALGAYIILCRESAWLPISKEDGTSAFQIVIPPFLAQVTIVYRWFSSPPPKTDDDDVLMPKWVVLAPPLMIIGILIATIAWLLADRGKTQDPGSLFKNAVTFCVSILAATSVYIAARVFSAGAAKRPRRKAPARE
jgi:hypothetical protein